MPWDLRGNNIASGDFLGTTNNLAVDIRSNGATSLLIAGPSSPVVQVIGTDKWHWVHGNIIVGSTTLLGITPFSADGEIRAKRISATSDPGRPAPGPAAIGEITAQSITAFRIVAPRTSDGRGGMDSRTNAFGWSGVYGETSHAEGFGVYGRAESSAQGRGYAGFFDGNVTVGGNGRFRVDGGDKNFRIDHPLAPAEKYLEHTCVESSERKNVYDGVERLDEDGTAWVELPEWFQALNKDFHYQLTAIGGAAPELHVAEEIADNRFRIAGGKAGMKVCWQVSGIRSDRWAEANPMVVEEEKPEEERGRYIQPELYGEPEEQCIGRGLPITEADLIEEQRDSQE
jgi:hypothetical protein